MGMGSTPQQKLFEGMKGPYEYGTSQARTVYDAAKNYPDYGTAMSEPLTVPINPMQEEAFGLMSGYAGAGGRGQQLAQSAESTMREALGGGTGYSGTQEQDILAGRVPMGAGTPYQAMADAFQQQSQRGLQDTLAAQRTGIVQHHKGGSNIGDDIQTRAFVENQQNINSQLAQMYGGAYKMAQDQRMPMAQLMADQQRVGMGAYPSIAGMPMSLYNQMATGGGALRGIDSEARAADIAAYQARGLQPTKRLEEYVSNLGGLGTTATGMAGLLA